MPSSQLPNTVIEQALLHYCYQESKVLHPPRCVALEHLRQTVDADWLAAWDYSNNDCEQPHHALLQHIHAAETLDSDGLHPLHKSDNHNLSLAKASAACLAHGGS